MNAGAAEEWRNRARELRAAERMIEADAAIARAAELAPADPLTAFLRAQSAYELGHPAADLFARAAALWPDNRDVVRNQALALAGEGRFPEAERVLAEALARAPDWLDGQRVLAGLRFSHGDGRDFDAGFAAAVAALPGHAGLWLGWFSTVAQQRDWARAGAILDEAEARLGETRALAVARAFLASESGAVGEALARLERIDGPDDGFLALCRIRTALRAGRAAEALALALPLTGTVIAGQVWPYVSTCWRLLGDRRAEWLDGAPAMLWTRDAGFGEADLAALAVRLRGLHIAARPYPEQSVRGGTQTDRSVLLRHEPELVAARARVMAAVRAVVAALPPADPSHPVLGRPRGGLRLAGSWSVRLGAGGYNVTHSHPAGWLSAVLYVAVPAAAGPGDAGNFHIGAPPAELGLDLAPYASVAPRPGQIVVFPSLLWHGTVPTVAGERLNIAADVAPA